MIRLFLGVLREGCRAKAGRMLAHERFWLSQMAQYPLKTYGHALAELNAAQARVYARGWLYLAGG